MTRTRDARVDEAIAEATLRLLGDWGYARLTMQAVADKARVGKPALYRRYADKAALVLAVIASRLPTLEVPDINDTRQELWLAVQRGLPENGPAYVGLIGGLIAEQDRQPELIDGFRRHVLLPRRAAVQEVVRRGQIRGDLRRDLDPGAAIDLMAGPFLARVFAGLDTGPKWRAAAFETWWELIRERTDR